MHFRHLMLTALPQTLSVKASAEIQNSVKSSDQNTVTLVEQNCYNATRVVLSVFPPAWEDKSAWGKTGTECLLIKEMHIRPKQTNTISITIPASVAPAGTLCALKFFVYSALEDQAQSISGRAVDSNEFTLVDGTGRWSQNELLPDGDMMMGPSRLLCEAVDCVRRCSDTAFPYQCRRNDANARHNITADDAQYECIRACPGFSRRPPISIIQNARAMAKLTGGPSTPTTETCAPAVSQYQTAGKDEL